ncbi:MAG: tetratricopeptide repeat protein [Rhodospirillales bacterium]|nr:tetratricopeptide repeat protein [Rhodospirillales bacterium]
MKKGEEYYECLREAVSLEGQKDWGAAIEACERALAMHPGGVEAQCVLGLIAAGMGDWGRAIEILERVHKEAPNCRDYADVLTVIYARVGKITESIYFAKLSMALEPDPRLTDIIPETFRDFKGAMDGAKLSANFVNAQVRFLERKYWDAEEFCVRYLRLNDRDAVAYVLLGRIRAAQGNFDDALDDFHTAIHLNPNHASAYLHLGDCLISLGRFDEGRACIRTATMQGPDDADLIARALYSLGRLPDCDGQGLANRALALTADCFADATEIDLSSAAGAGEGRKIRIGYVSDGFCDGELGHLIGSLFNNHDRNRFEIFGYQQNVIQDMTTTRQKANAFGWREIFDVDDDTAAYMIGGDGLDILVDLCSYAEGQRLGLLARKPAGVVASWLGWPNGMGVPAINFVISDADNMEADQALAGERQCIALKGGIFAFDAGFSDLQTENSSDREDRGIGAVTFGAVCNLSRISPSTVGVWARILRACPGSQLMFGYVDAVSPMVKTRVRDLFSHFGVLDRIMFQIPSDEEAANMRFFANVDVMLDSFPVNGVSETCSALLMGVPVVSMAGTGRPETMGASILRAAGRQEWVARSEDAYIMIATGLASDMGKLGQLRATLGEEVRQSRLCDIEGFVRSLEKTFERMLGQN